MNISVVIITKNEEANIERCLRSVDWANEVIVLDSGSTDRTIEISQKLGARVSVTADWPGFGPQKNRALERATGEWVMSLDADEWVTPDLRDEILNVISRPNGAMAFRVPRLSSFCGRFMRHSGWWPDYVTRLFRRGAARFSDDVVHERVIAGGKTGTLRTNEMNFYVRDEWRVSNKLFESLKLLLHNFDWTFGLKFVLPNLNFQSVVGVHWNPFYGRQ